MLRWARSLLPVVALVSGACNSTPEEVTTDLSGSSSSSDTSAGTTVTPGTTTTGTTSPVEDGSSTSPSETAMDTTGPVSSTSESSSSGPQPECTGREGCGGNEDCEDGVCVEACGGAWGEGSYGYCLTEYGDVGTDELCGDGHLCAAWGDPIEQTACALQGCVDACDCPPPPATGTATVTCGEIIAHARMNDCFLSCKDGETCPDGMHCVDGSVCATGVVDVPVYGDCGKLAADCAPPAFCTVAPTGEAVCTTGCLDSLECPVEFPPGGNATPACTDIDARSPGFECYLDCIGSLTCPDGMTCVNGTLCMWQD